MAGQSLKLAIDLDEVLADHLQPLLAFANKKVGMQVPYDKVSSTSLRKLFNISRDEAVKIYEAFRDGQEISDISTVKGAVEAVNILSKSNELFIVTARPRRVMRYTKEWLARQYNGINFSEIVFTEDELGHFTDKSDICRAKNIGIIIEDDLMTAIACAKQNIQVLLIDYPWNQGKLPKMVERIDGWEMIPGFVDKIKAARKNHSHEAI